MSHPKVIFDTSCIITAILSLKRSYIHDILAQLETDYFRPYSEKRMVQELLSTLQKDYIQQSMKQGSQRIPNLVERYLKATSVVEVPAKQKISRSRDPNDDMFLELASFIHADYIVSVDKDLVVLQKYNQTQIVRPKEFFKAEIQQRAKL